MPRFGCDRQQLHDDPADDQKKRQDGGPDGGQRHRQRSLPGEKSQTPHAKEGADANGQQAPAPRVNGPERQWRQKHDNNEELKHPGYALTAILTFITGPDQQSKENHTMTRRACFRLTGGGHPYHDREMVPPR